MRIEWGAELQEISMEAGVLNYNQLDEDVHHLDYEVNPYLLNHYGTITPQWSLWYQSTTF